MQKGLQGNHVAHLREKIFNPHEWLLFWCFHHSLVNRLSFNQLIFIHNLNSIKLNKSHSGLQLFAKEQLHLKNCWAWYKAWYRCLSIYGARNNTKIAKLPEERKINFFSILLKIEYWCIYTWRKQKGAPKKANFKISSFNLDLCFERGCISNLRVSMTSESRKKARSQTTVPKSNLSLAASIFPAILYSNIHFTMQVFVKVFLS